MGETPNWEALGAACLRDDIDPDLFHGWDREGNTDRNIETRRIERAKEVCETLCPMKCYYACEEWANTLKPSDMEGVMAGKTKKERQALRRG